MQRNHPAGLTLNQEAKASVGYTLFSTLGDTTTYLIDMEGRVVHRWELPFSPGDWGYLLEDGRLLYGGYTARSPATFGGAGGIVLEADWDGNILWRYQEDSLHHDFCRLDNGNTMVVGWEPIPREMAPLVRGGQPGTEHEQGIWSDYIKEITPGGDTAWLWHAYEHLNVEEDVLCPLHERHEWTHANTCKVLPDGNLLVCFRVIDTVAIVERGTGKFLWKYGRGQLGHPHDPTQLGNGNILIFDNGAHRKTDARTASRVIEVNPATDEIVWEYWDQPVFNFYSPYISGARRLPNGNTLITEGNFGRMFQVTPDGQVVWEYVNPYYPEGPDGVPTNAVFKATHYLREDIPRL